jgi:hypothetical protein
MCQSIHPKFGRPTQPQRCLRWTERHFSLAVSVTASLLAVVGMSVAFVYPHFHSGIARAEADVRAGWAVVDALENEAAEQVQEARHHKQQAEERQRVLDANKYRGDSGWDEFARGHVAYHARLRAARCARRDVLIHLATEYRRLVVEAECELLAAKSARDRGVPHKVAPRVRQLLTPVLGNR